jgi:ribosomal protein S18 acetylase RimI-like enzyme
MEADEREQPGVLETDAFLVRAMRGDDLEAIVAIDAVAAGRRRPRYFGLMLERALGQASLQISLVAELGERVVGFVLASLYYGEYGVMEPSASIDAIGVALGFRGRHVGKALMRQLRLNLGALHISSLRTEVSWDDFELMAFFKSEGFAPSGSMCLERKLDPTEPEL